MLACTGIFVTEAGFRWPGYLSKSLDLKFEDVPGGALDSYAAVPALGWLQIVAFIIILELGYGATPPGNAPGDVGGPTWIRYDDPEVGRCRAPRGASEGKPPAAARGGGGRGGAARGPASHKLSFLSTATSNNLHSTYSPAPLGAKRRLTCENAREFQGGDTTARCARSAVADLAALAALTANEASLQPGFEEVDTRIQAAVPFYGIYDFADRHGVRGKSSMRPMLERVVMPVPLEGNPEAWDRASPVCWVNDEAPPFFVIHGDQDALAFVEDARLFVAALRGVSQEPVAYAEVPYAQHAFDVFHSRRSAEAVGAASRFLEWARAHRPAGRGGA